MLSRTQRLPARSATATRTRSSRWPAARSAALGAAWLLSACGGGGDGSPAPSPPPSAGLTLAEFDICLPGQTVGGCLAAGSNGEFVPATQGRYFYGGGHMQKHATLLGLGGMDNAALAAEMRSVLGSDIGLAFSQPQLAGGAISSAADYAVFLRKLLSGSLRHGALLGQASVCASPGACPGQALYTPIPATEQWRYSTGHWVETDPVVGDGAFSSAGAFGFYPWIDAGRTVYGVVARREATANAGYASAGCGRLIRKAWLTGAS